jgi:hypothetical protein
MLSLKYTDGELIKNVDWNTLPNKTIRYMDFKVGNQTIRFMGYQRYLRLKEMVYGVNNGLRGMSKVILVGDKGVSCTKVTIDMLNKKITKEEVLSIEVYNGQTIDNKFWKIGEKNDAPNVYISPAKID